MLMEAFLSLSYLSFESVVINLACGDCVFVFVCGDVGGVDGLIFLFLSFKEFVCDSIGKSVASRMFLIRYAHEE